MHHYVVYVHTLIATLILLAAMIKRYRRDVWVPALFVLAFVVIDQVFGQPDTQRTQPILEHADDLFTLLKWIIISLLAVIVFGIKLWLSDFSNWKKEIIILITKVETKLDNHLKDSRDSDSE